MSSAIRIEDLWKEYRLGVIGHGSMRQDLQSWWARMRGLEDPNSLIGDPQADRDTSADGRFYALQGVELDIRHGEMLGIIGRNGAGKSTLLKVLSRITSPTRGTVKVRGRIVSLLEVGTGFHPELTGRDNVFLNGAILGMSRAEIRRKFDEIVEFSGIERFIDTPVKRYSSGMYVRLAFAVAAHLDPEILIVDEVLAVGDYEFQKKCMGKMSQVTTEQGRTVLLVSHNMAAVRRLCNRTALLSKGRLLGVGPTHEIVHRYLTEVTASQAELLQPARPDKDVHLRAVRVRDAMGKVGMEVEYTEGFQVEVEYDVNQPTRNCIVWAAVRGMDETEVFCSSDYDATPDLLGPRQVGQYRTKLRIPGRLLNNGAYYIVVGIVCQAPEVSYDRVELTGLSVIDTKGLISAEHSRRSGLVKPLLPWTTECL